ncbi:MAG TPA: septal ring lytic transglycosylase RlpA family protein [Solirubrobacteraceae bacterium]|jgi:rare lipoprotein A (peptidoglycan hydrolase)|nr:septal ring lytic transglycosylase RlpA family protein [Solirubrobacteraceae bacterium]
MHRSRRPSIAAAAAASTIALVAAVAAGCGASSPADTGPHRRSSLTTAQANDPPPGGASAPTAAKAPPTAAKASPPTPSPSPQTTSSAQRAPGNVPPAHPVPAAFRPAPGAPSDAQVRSELAQLDAIHREEHQRALSAAAASLAGLLPWSSEPRAGMQVSVASVFTDYGLGLACGGVLGREQLGVAHKTAPCGTLVTFTYAGRSLTVPVIDRGPYIAGREWDLTGATAAALGFPGLGQIQWSVAGGR